ncbi:unnamed protein product [Arabis nemorensis]|uniref:Uncharacterized protein n=1 Tax=Arabis nemorensis TaxID=586526 RepID=A0A565BUV3_9BRAS|nr:unnamed protein product [Arabis nemorensis]
MNQGRLACGRDCAADKTATCHPCSGQCADRAGRQDQSAMCRSHSGHRLAQDWAAELTRHMSVMR